MLKVVLFVIVLGVAIYFLVRLVDRGNGSGNASTPKRPIVGPDDDPDFLRWLDRKRKRDQGK